MYVRITRSIQHAARRIEQAVHGQAEAIGNQHKDKRAERAEVSARVAPDRGPARRHPDPALDQIKENGAEQAEDQGHERPVVEEPLEGEAKKIETQVDAEERV